MRLNELQASLWAGVTEAACGDADRWAKGTPAFSASERVHVYASMYRARQVEAMAVDFPSLQALVGEARFEELVDGYTRIHLSLHPSLARRGERFASYLQDVGEAPLAALAALEWARAEVFLERDAPALSVETLGALPPEEFASVRLLPVPSLRLVQLEHNPMQAWREHENAHAVTSAPQPGSLALVVWRDGEQVSHVSVDAREADALRRVTEGRTVSEVLEVFGEDAEGVAHAFAALASWVNEGWIRE